jgi:subtilase family serine protease
VPGFAGLARAALIPALLLAAAAASPGTARAGTVNGRIRYEDRPLTPSGFDTVRLLPVRFAQVSIVNTAGNLVVATATTDGSGAYATSVPSVGTQTLFVRVDALNERTDDRIDVRVLSDTTSRTQLSAAGPQRAVDTSGPVVLDVDIPVAGGGGGAFNIFDQGVRAQEFVNRFSTRTPPRLTFFWQPVPDGPGSDDGVFFDPNDNSIHLLDRLTANARVTNAPNSDEYDDSVMLHEVGHYVIENYAVDKSLGGTHFIDSGREDIRLAWSEGVATHFAAMVANDPFLVNSLGDAARTSFEIETPDFAATATGFDAEQAVSAMLWDVFDANATPRPGGSATDDDAIRLTDGDARIMDVLVNDYTAADDAIWEDFVNKFRARHGASFLRPELEDVMSARSVFVDRPTLFANTTAADVPAGGQVTSTINVPFSITLATVKVFVSATARTVEDATTNTFSVPDTVVSLRSPAGSVVTLHDRGTTTAADGLFEWYSQFETPLPPGQSLATFASQNGQGNWTLTVANSGTAASRLRTWRLDLAGTAIVPDLTITGVTAPATAAAGTAVSASATVVNRGNAVATGVTVRFFLSTDGVISASDTALGDSTVATLGIGAQTVVTRSVTIPAGLAPGSYTLGAIVDPDARVIESNEGNNVSSPAAPVTITGAGIDLAVTALDVPSSALIGGTLPVTVTVQNVGTVSTASTFETRVFLSATGVIDATSILLGSFTRSGLAAGERAAVGQDFTIPTTVASGNYSVCAQVDATNTVAESLETNNSRCAGPVAVTGPTTDPDLVITAVGTPGAGTIGELYPMTATVRNTGSVVAQPAFVTRFFLSDDATITATDREIGSASTASLAAGASVVVANPGRIPAGTPAGIYFAGAITNADSTVVEFSTANNAAAAPQPVVVGATGATGDLAVASVQAPATAAPGGGIAISVTVANVGGDDIAVVFPTRFFLSADRTITAADVFLGEIQTSGLAAGAARVLSGTFAVPIDLAPGSYFVGVVTDPAGAVTDRDRANNVAVSPAAVGIGIGPLADLTPSIPNPREPPSLATVGATVTALERVANGGTREAAAGWRTRWVLSADETITTTDVFLSDFVNGTLQAGSTAVQSRALTIPATIAPGRYFFGVVADPDGRVVESNEGNNAAASASVTITAPPAGADLAVTDPPEIRPDTINAGSFGIASFTVRNLGTGVAPGPFSVGVFLSTTQATSGSTVFLGSVSVPTVAPLGLSARIDFPFQIPPDTVRGPYFIGLIADLTRAVSDVNRANNVSPGAPVGVEGRQPLAVPLALLVQAFDDRDREVSAATKGGRVTFKARIANGGEAPAPFPFQTAFFLSSTAAGLVPLGNVTIPGLGPFDSTQAVLTTTIPLAIPDDAYFVRAEADPFDQVRPKLEDPRSIVDSARTIAISAPTVAPNLVVTALTAPPAAVVGQAITVTGRIGNSGNLGTGNPFSNQIVVSRSVTPTAADPVIDTFTAPAIGAGGALNVSRAVVIPSALAPGAYFIALIANSPASIAERTAADNTFSVPITLAGGPDLAPQTVSFTPAAIAPGGTLTFNTTVRNEGAAAVSPPPTRLVNRYFLGRNRPVTAADILLGVELVPIDGGIAAGGSVASVARLVVPPGTAPGAYFVGVLTDAVNAIVEQREDNNFFTTAAQVQVLGGSSLVAEEVAAPATVRGGEPMTPSVRVRNAGVATPGQALEVLFSFVQVNPPFNAFTVGTATVAAADLAPGTFRVFTPTLTVPTTIPAGLYRIRAQLDPANRIPELDESAGSHTVTAVSPTGVVQATTPGATVTLTFSAAPGTPVPAGPLTINALFSRPVSQPSIAIDTPGTNRLTLTPMQGAGTLWSFAYAVPRDNDRFDRDGVYTVRVEGGLDVDGTPNAPVTANNTFTADTRAPVFIVDNVRDGDIVPDPIAPSGRVEDASPVNARVDVVGDRGGAGADVFATVPPAGTFTVAGLGLPDPVDSLTFNGTDAAGNPAVSRILTVQRDQDGDGMPDAFEDANALDDANPADAALQAPGYPPGFTNLDVFRFGLTTAAPPAGDPRVLVAAGAVAPRATVPPGVIRPAVTVTSNTGGGTVGFSWRQVGGPSVVLSSAASATPSFVGRQAGRYDFEVLLTNAVGRSLPIVQTIDVAGVPPRAAIAGGGRVPVGADVLLDGTPSSDANGETLAYLWRSDGANPAAQVLLTTTARSSFVPQAVGTYRFFLRVRDGAGMESGEAAVEFVAADTAAQRVPPTADAGLDQTVVSGLAVTLDGGSSQSGDPSSSIAYQWSQVSGPPAALAAANTPRPSFLPPGPGVFVFSLVVTSEAADRLASAADRVQVVVTGPPGRHPTAIAGGPVRRVLGETVTLDGSASRAVAAGGALTYRWTQVAGPALGAPPAAVAQPIIGPGSVGDHTFELVVIEAGVPSPPDTVQVTIVPAAVDQPPVANVTLRGLPLRQPEYRIALPASGTAQVDLDGSASFDPLARNLAYRWSQVSGPAVALSSLEFASSSFVAYAPGVHGFDLVVDNGVSRVAGHIDVIVDSADRVVPRAAIRALPGNQASTAAEVTLAGSSPSAPSAQPRSFRWVQVDGPIVALKGAGSDAATFTPRDPGTYAFALFVTDGTLRSPPETYTFQVVEAVVPPAAPAPGGGGPAPSPGGDVGVGGGGGAGCSGAAAAAASARTGGAPFLLLPLIVLLALGSGRRRAQLPVPARSSTIDSSDTTRAGAGAPGGRAVAGPSTSAAVTSVSAPSADNAASSSTLASGAAPTRTTASAAPNV